MTTSQQKLLPWLSNLVTKTIDQGLPVLPEVLFICRKQFRKSLFVSQGQVSQNHSPFSILFLLCCSLLCSALLFCSVLCSSLLCVLSGREMPFSGREIAFSGREKTMGMGISPVAAEWQGCGAVFRSHPYRGLCGKLTTNGQLREYFSVCISFSVGCATVNCGKSAREGALRYDLGTPFVNSSAPAEP